MTKTGTMEIVRTPRLHNTGGIEHPEKTRMFYRGPLHLMPEPRLVPLPFKSAVVLLKKNPAGLF